MSAPDALAAVTARAGYMMGANVDRDWAPAHAAAWEGLLEISRRLRRDAEALLEERHEIGIGMLGIMGRLARAPGRTLRQTDLADATGLSLSRISRIIDALEDRGLVVRRPCPADGRATNVTLTVRGRTRTASAQDTTYAFVREAFVERVSDEEMAVLAAVFTRLVAEDPAGDCGT